MKIYTVNDRGMKFITAELIENQQGFANYRPELQDRAARFYAGDVESSLSHGNGPTCEVGKHASIDGTPHVITLDRTMFDAAIDWPQWLQHCHSPEDVAHILHQETDPADRAMAGGYYIAQAALEAARDGDVPAPWDDNPMYLVNYMTSLPVAILDALRSAQFGALRSACKLLRHMHADGWKPLATQPIDGPAYWTGSWANDTVDTDGYTRHFDTIDTAFGPLDCIVQRIRATLDAIRFDELEPSLRIAVLEDTTHAVSEWDFMLATTGGASYHVAHLMPARRGGVVLVGNGYSGSASWTNASSVLDTLDRYVRNDMTP